MYFGSQLVEDLGPGVVILLLIGRHVIEANAD